MSSISSIPPFVPVKAPEAHRAESPGGEDRAPQTPTEADAPQPTVLAPLPPGQGTRIDQLV